MSDSSSSENALAGLTPAMISALRARHTAFLAERLTDERARGDFGRSLAAGYDHVLSLPLRALIEPKRLVGQIAALLSNETVRGFLSPIAREINRRVVTNLRSDSVKLGAYVPEEARASLNELIARPDLIPEELVRKVFDDEVTEQIMRDVMYDALVEFNESVNQFFAEWGLPALVKKVLPIGSNTVLKSMSTVRAEFDKRLEPEMRKFLLGFSRRSKKKLADIMIASAGDPKFVAMRQSIVAFLFEEAISDLMKNVDDDARMNADEVVEAIVLAVLKHERPRERLLAELELLIETHGDDTVGTWLGRIGVTERPDVETLAELLWPYVRLALESPPARAFYERVTWDFYASLAQASAARTDESG